MKRKIIRTYQLSDAFLPERCDELVSSLTQDQYVLAEYGFTLSKITPLQALKTAFITAGGDETYMGIMMSAKLVRDNARGVLYDAMFKLAQKVETKWPNDAPKQIEFALAGSLSQLNAPSLLRQARVTAVALTKYQADLGTEFGITQGYITSFDDKISALDEAGTVFDTAVNIRKAKTVERVVAGNALYKMMLDLCAIGKNYWESMNNPANYDQYVLTSNNPQLDEVVNLTLEAGQQQEVMITGISSNTNLLLENLSTEPVQEWFADLPGTPPPPENAVIDPLSSQNHLAGELNYDTNNTKYYVKNLGANAAAIKITAMN